MLALPAADLGSLRLVVASDPCEMTDASPWRGQIFYGIREKPRERDHFDRIWSFRSTPYIIYGLLEGEYELEVFPGHLNDPGLGSSEGSRTYVFWIRGGEETTLAVDDPNRD